MKTCRHPDCQHKYGWTHRGGNVNKFLGEEYGEFFSLESGDFSTVSVTRFHGDASNLKVMGCPKCFRLSIVKEEYLDD